MTTASAPDLSAVFAGLAITPSDEPLPEPRRGGQPSGPNPFTEPLAASVEHNKPYTIYVPTNAVQRATFLINSAARKANHGVRVVVDVKRDDKGAIVKGKDGKAQYVVQQQGENKGKVMVRFQGKKERKAQTAPRPYSLLRDKTDENVWLVRDRASKAVLFRGNRDDAKADYERRKLLFIEAERQRIADAANAAPTPTGTPSPTPASTVEQEQGKEPSDVEAKQEAPTPA